MPATRHLGRAVAFLTPLLPLALAHGQLRVFSSSHGSWTAADAYGPSNASSPIRKVDWYGPATNFTSPNITCGEGGNTPVEALATVSAGELVTFDWGSWGSNHSGPVMTYMAQCVNGCATFAGDSGGIWVKIDQDSCNNTYGIIGWGVSSEDRGKPALHGDHILIPLLYPKILALHIAATPYGAQFYPNCVQVRVVDGGDVVLPRGVALPGVYDPNDTLGILVDLYAIENRGVPFVSPGGPVLLPGGNGSWGTDVYGA
ncbi:glycosyl hydrolase family 61-domain-containing protein [Auriculariales sp. MPI-PUGE-AT-0066]|nr:glycosyl hydrolase family 61-domain-containing protein [Auriculariales sp. MPI-PUGE-AT-0066]